MNHERLYVERRETYRAFLQETRRLVGALERDDWEAAEAALAERDELIQRLAGRTLPDPVDEAHQALIQECLDLARECSEVNARVGPLLAGAHQRLAEEMRKKPSATRRSPYADGTGGGMDLRA